ncbi:MAG: 1-pyrroline-5-carboxylate dehydrogenase [Actinobacteria bacterium HGW-Actinobacteria-4]|nr:MAG: 1-pyrroline-5-carboxylate dehydrogenase [Actinobacteria bacterium HGW-Actinobacteria-4]
MSATDDFHAEAQQNAREVASLESAAIEQARTWVDASTAVKPDIAAARLASLLRDQHGLAFTVGFVDGVVRPEDRMVAARNLRALSRSAPAFLSWPMRLAVRVGGALAPIAPPVVVPIARRVLRSMVRHLIIDARPRPLGRAIRRLRGSAPGGVRLNINLLGEAVLGDAEAQRRLRGVRSLIARADVDYVSVKASAAVAPHSPWSFDHAVSEAVAALKPLYVEAANTPGGPTFINLDMEEYRDLALTLEVFTTLLDDPDLRGFRAGIALQAYLPDALSAMIRLQEWAAQRVASGGAPIKVRIVKGANLPMERVDADLHDWPLATWNSKVETDANYKALLAYALRPERVANVGVGVAGHNLFDIALAWELAGARGVWDAMDVEMLLGMAPQQAAAVRDTVGSLLLYTPVVSPPEFDTAIAYLIRRLDEGASQDNFMSAVFDLHDPALFERECERFRASVPLMPTRIPGPHRTQNRAAEHPTPAEGVFANTPDTDPSVPDNLAWATSVRDRIPASAAGTDTADAARVASAADLDAVMDTARRAGMRWGATPAAERAGILRRAGAELARRRAELMEVMGSECGKVVEQSDPEVSEAIDFANYYAASAEQLDQVDGARFEPVQVTVVTPPWNFPVAIPAGGVLAALAAGSAVVLKPAELARRCGAVVAEALWSAGVPRDVLQLVGVAERELGRALISHPHTDQVILTGGYETAQLFLSFTPELRLFAETSGKNAIIVTPSADLELAAKDVVASAFGHAGQKCSAASLVILVGSVASSRRFRRQLADAAASLRVGSPELESSQVGPVIEKPHGKLAHALTTLEPGQSWLLEPRCLNADGKPSAEGTLWSPGIREGVKPGDESHLTEYFGPVLGVMEAATLDDAIRMVNEVEFGLTSGLHSLDDAEIARWLARVEAGNLYVNRGITGAIVQRQPFGGWKRSTVGTGTKAGGPHYVAGLGRWVDAPPRRGDGEGALGDALTQEVLAAARAAGLEDAGLDWLAAALATDEHEFAQRYGAVVDATGLEYERNALRYQAVPVTVRASRPAPELLLRALAAGLRVGASLTLSYESALPQWLTQVLERSGVALHNEDSGAWAERAASLVHTGGRVRLIGAGDVPADPAPTLAATEGSPAVALFNGPVVSSGVIEMLPYLREQAVCVSAHRFGVRRDVEVPPLKPRAN